MDVVLYEINSKLDLLSCVCIYIKQDELYGSNRCKICVLNWKTYHFSMYRVAHEKPARSLVDQRGCRSRTLYRKLNKCKCKVLTG